LEDKVLTKKVWNRLTIANSFSLVCKNPCGVSIVHVPQYLQLDQLDLGYIDLLDFKLVIPFHFYFVHDSSLPSGVYCCLFETNSIPHKNDGLLLHKYRVFHMVAPSSNFRTDTILRNTDNICDDDKCT